MTITRIDRGPRLSQAVVHGNTVYLAGQVGTPGASVTEQTRAILAQVDDLLAKAGSSRKHLLTAMVLLTDIGDFAEMNAVWDSWVADVGAPTRATFEAKLSEPLLKVEIVITAATA
jgi:enamine deaminase RidA (YjgF/YER057c/UK114 family)